MKMFHKCSTCDNKHCVKQKTHQASGSATLASRRLTEGTSAVIMHPSLESEHKLEGENGVWVELNWALTLRGFAIQDERLLKRSVLGVKDNRGKKKSQGTFLVTF